MREAGRALALDPTLPAAGELITRMMLEPPTVLPAEVTQGFDVESKDVARRTIGVGATASAAYLLFVPLLAIGGGATLAELAILGGASAAAVLLLLWARTPGRKFIAPLVMALHLILIAMCSRMYTPFLLGPGLAAVTAMGLMTGPQYAKRQATWIVLLTCLAVLGPWFAEHVGWLSRTLSVFDGGVVIHSRAIRGSTSAFALLIPFTVAIVAASVILSRGLRQAERAARRHMHVQAWQLRQLVAPQAARS